VWQPERVGEDTPEEPDHGAALTAMKGRRGLVLVNRGDEVDIHQMPFFRCQVVDEWAFDVERARSAFQACRVEMGNLDDVVLALRPRDGTVGELECAVLLAVVQELVACPGTVACLWVVTRGGLVARDWREPVCPRFGPMVGLARVAMQEHPELGCTLVDVGAETDMPWLCSLLHGG